MRHNHRSSNRDKVIAEFKADVLLAQIQDKSPAEISQWVDNNVNDVQDVKNVLKRLILLIQLIDLQ